MEKVNKTQESATRSHAHVSTVLFIYLFISLFVYLFVSLYLSLPSRDHKKIFVERGLNSLNK